MEQHRKYVGDKRYNSLSQNSKTKISVISSPEYRTKGEDIILVKNVPTCRIVLDTTTTSNIVIKALTKVTITPLINKIDEEYDELFIDKGACVELYNIDNNWYIFSSDGLKVE
jgi:hypothetical protein